MLLIRTWFVRRREAQSGRAAPRLLIDIVTFGVVVITVALLLSNVWGLPVSNTLSTLGLGSIVIGLALQDTLGNLFAGVSLMTERPYVIGDWITIDDLEGRVVEVNWRAVHVMTRNQDLVILPNATVAASIITNEVRPTQLKAIPVNVGFSYNDPPNKVKAVLRRAALATQGVRREPEPTIRVTGYGDSSIDYEVRLFLDNHDERPDILDRFNARIWYAAKRSGLNIPFPIRTVYHQRMPPPDEVAAHDRMACLRGIDIFRPLEDEDLKRLAQSARLMVFGHDEHVVKQGDRDDAMYALLSGEANVVVDEAKGGRGTVVGPVEGRRLLRRDGCPHRRAAYGVGGRRSRPGGAGDPLRRSARSAGGAAGTGRGHRRGGHRTANAVGRVATERQRGECRAGVERIQPTRGGGADSGLPGALRPPPRGILRHRDRIETPELP